MNKGLLDIMPPNLLADKKIYNVCLALDSTLKSISDECNIPSLIHNIDRLDSEFIDLLAYQFHVDFYDEALSLDIRRELVKKSIDYHMRKGTPYAMDGVVGLVFPDGVVEENWEYGGESYHFRVNNITVGMAGPKTLEQLMRAIDSVKNVRSTLDEIIFKRENTGIQYIGGVLSQHTKVRVNPKYISDTVNIGVRYIGGVLSQHTKVRANPKYISDTVNTGARYIGGVIGCYKKIRVMPELIKDSYTERVIYIGGVLATYKKIKAMLM